MYIHTRSIVDKVFDVWRSPGRFTKNPDIIQLPSGRLMLVYSDTDAHWAQSSEILTLVASDDLGKTWFKFRELAKAVQPQDERLVTPRLSRLKDGRLVVLCDHNDFGYFHEDQPCGNWAWWSKDDGESWSAHQVTGIMGFEPDRMLDLPDGSLGVASHVMLGESQEFAEILTCSTDGGKTWQQRSIMAHNGYHRFCEGALILLDDGQELACVIRENHSAGIPSLVTFSQDNGHTWSEPQILPFAIHRPYVKQLPDGRVLVTGRHVNGGLGTYAWCGNLHDEAGTWVVGGPRRKHLAELTDEALVIENKPEHECRYTLLPPESCRSDVLFEATLRVEGPDDEIVAFLSVNTLQTMGIPCILHIAPNWVAVSPQRADNRKPIDMTKEHTITIRHRRGLLEILIDGQRIMSGCVFHESPHLADFHGGNPAKRTQFGQFGDTGRSFWTHLRYDVKNPTLPDISWSWDASANQWPDRYQRERMLQIHGNHPDQKPWPDHGYSSWVTLPDGRIMFVDYTNCGDEPGKSHIVGVYIEPEDIA
ncbi:MAG: exo-alpha-sialidase [bacterium]|nr:exo-alpha-sialidase [bacterium]